MRQCLSESERTAYSTITNAWQKEGRTMRRQRFDRGNRILDGCCHVARLLHQDTDTRSAAPCPSDRGGQRPKDPKSRQPARGACAALAVASAASLVSCSSSPGPTPSDSPSTSGTAGPYSSNMDSSYSSNTDVSTTSDTAADRPQVRGNVPAI